MPGRSGSLWMYPSAVPRISLDSEKKHILVTSCTSVVIMGRLGSDILQILSSLPEPRTLTCFLKGSVERNVIVIRENNLLRHCKKFNVLLRWK